MWFVACSGFPVPVSRYWRELPAIEISDTEIGIPGDGTLRRWARESGPEYGFSLLAPKPIGESGFRRTKENKAHVEAIGEVAGKLSAKAVAFAAPKRFAPDKTSRAAVKSFLTGLPKDFPTPVLDLPAWAPVEVAKALGKRPAVVAYDPLEDEPPPAGELAYLRLPGPAGPRSRYDDEAIERIAEHIRGLDAGTVFCVFRNVDMHTNAKSLLARLG